MVKAKESELKKILDALIVRDHEDREAERIIRKDLLRQGLIEKVPSKIIKIDAGNITGVGNVVGEILKELKGEERFIALEGRSGTGKSSVADALAQELKAIRFSLGEVFRLFAYCANVNKTFSFENIVKDLSYSIEDGKAYLFWGKKNVTRKLKDDLRSPDLEKKLPEISKKVYKLIIDFIDCEIKRLNKSHSLRFVIEGRGLSLDFLPSDIRIKLVADPITRARRRHRQNHGH